MSQLFVEDEVLLDLEALAEKYDPTPHEFERDPTGWVNERLDEFVWSKQDEILQSIATNRYTAVPSAHGPGKSWTAARSACWWLDIHPPGEAFVVTTAPTWNQVHAILWREIRRAHVKAGLPGRTTLDARWYMGGKRAGDPAEELVAYGRKPADYDQAAFQGIHARFVLILIDEASGIPRLLYDAVDSLATNESARVLAIGNPDDPASQFATICKPGSGWNVIPISAFDTPVFTGEQVPERLLELLPSREWVEERKKRWGVSSPTYISKVLGQFPDIGEDTLISPRLIREAEERDLSARGRQPGSYGFDIARYGSDLTVGYRTRGGVLRKVYEIAKSSTMTTAGAIYQRVEPHKGKVPAMVDVVGLGAGVVDRLVEQGVKGVMPFNAGARAHDPTRFVDRRAEVYWGFRELMEEGEIDLPPHGEDDELKAQLGSIKWTVDSRGKIRIESKDDMKRRGLPSPDHADAAVMACSPVSSTFDLTQRTKREDGDGDLTSDLLTRPM